jgi:hypothetical protein
MSSTSKEQARVKLLIAGTQKHFGNAASLTFSDASFTPASALVQLLVGYSATFDDVDTARVTLNAKVAARKARQPSMRAVIRKYETYLQGLYNGLPDVLADFGLAPPKARAVSVATKGQAVVKSRATRQARHTMGKRQRQKVKGEVSSPAAPPAPPLPNGTPAATKS